MTSIVRQESEALAILSRLEAYAPLLADELVRDTFRGADGSHNFMLRRRDGTALVVFDAHASVGQVDAIAALYAHAHLLIALARIGLESQLPAPGAAYGCPHCGADQVRRFVARRERGRVAAELWCPACETEWSEIGPGGAGADVAPIAG